MKNFLGKRFLGCAALLFGLSASVAAPAQDVHYYAVPAGSHPHDVAPAADGTVWYTAQSIGKLGRLDPKTGKVEEIVLGDKSAPHGVIIGPDGAPWVTDGGQNAIVRVDPKTKAIDKFPLPETTGYTNLNTLTFDKKGVIWFTGQNGYYGRVDPKQHKVEAFKAPRGRGPYGITTTPSGEVYYASLAGNHIAQIDTTTGVVTPIEPPTAKQGARRIWSDSQGHLWVSEWNSGNLSKFDPATKTWKHWTPPGDKPQTYAVYVDENDAVWITQWAANAIMRFDPKTETFKTFASDKPDAEVRQLNGRPGQVWGAESGLDRLVSVTYAPSKVTN